jgi:hypothetical protein
MLFEYENEERKSLVLKMNHLSLTTNYNNIQPTIPSHYGHSRTASNGSNISIDPSLINYRSHSRTPSGNFNFLSLNNTNPHAHGGHSRSASGGGGTLNFDLNTGTLISFHKHLTHSRNASNCSNISFVSRLSEPISEAGLGGSNGNITINSTTGIFNVTQVTIPNSNATIAAVQYYSEQVRNEMRESNTKLDVNTTINNEIEDEESYNDDAEVIIKNDDENDEEIENTEQENTDANNTLANLHLTCIDEIDAGNEADIDEDECYKTKNIQQQKRKNSKTIVNNDEKIIITDEINPDDNDSPVNDKTE